MLALKKPYVDSAKVKLHDQQLRRSLLLLLQCSVSRLQVQDHMSDVLYLFHV